MASMIQTFAQKLKHTGLMALCVLTVLSNVAFADAPSERQAFLRQSFTKEIPLPKTLWLDAKIKSDVKKILRHDYPGLRVRYWQDGPRTLWILDEVGKYKPITVGIVINQGAIEKLKVLAYRESHGWEVKHDFFTRQFIGARLPKKLKLDRHIDGISGATLSVRALKKLALLALYFDQQVLSK